MLSKIQQIITEELRLSETRIWAHLETLLEENGEDVGDGTFEYTPSLFIPYEENNNDENNIISWLEFLNKA